MSLGAYYNEIDPYAAQWLRNLIAAGHIAPGDVDERSIEDVYHDDLRGYTQCHFFAGVGVWSYALRAAGWPDDRPVWTGSCPCQPFSSAGKGAGFDDERHLWPHWHHLIKERKPPAVFGEQVASKDSGPWIDLVHTDMEALGYAFGAVPFPSASVGAPHMRDRLFWVAYAEHRGRTTGKPKRSRPSAALPPGVNRQLAHANSDGHDRAQGNAAIPSGYKSNERLPVGDSATCVVADTADQRWHGRRSSIESDGQRSARIESERLRDVNQLGDAESERCRETGRTDAGPAQWPTDAGADRRLANTSSSGLSPCECATVLREGWRQEGRAIEPCGGAPGRMADAQQHDRRCEAESANHNGAQADRSSDRACGCDCASCQLGHSSDEPSERDAGSISSPQAKVDRARVINGSCAHGSELASSSMAPRPGPTNGHWADVDWLLCRDGKWRPVEPGTFPLAHGATARVGRLRAYGNAINAQAAQVFIEAFLNSEISA